MLWNAYLLIKAPLLFVAKSNFLLRGFLSLKMVVTIKFKILSKVVLEATDNNSLIF